MFKKFICILLSLVLALSSSILVLSKENVDPEIVILQAETFTINIAEDIKILAKITDFETAFLCYSNGQDNQYTKVEMTMTNTLDGYLEGTIPKEIFNHNIVTYYVEAIGEGKKVIESKKHYIQFDQKEKKKPTEQEIVIMSAGDYFYDIQFYNGILPSGYSISPMTAKSPIRQNTTTDLYPTVTSKLGEIRAVSPNPHNGVDLGIVRGTPVYPALDGVIVGTLGGSFGLVIVRHQIGNAVFYSRYMHMADINTSLKDGVRVYTTTQIGTVSDVGAPGAVHLDFSFYTTDSSGNKRFMPTKYFYNSINGWNYGLDLDFSQSPTRNYDYAYGTYILINIYPKGSSSYPTINANLYWRVKGSTGSFNITSMTKINTTDYRAYLNSYLDGQVVEYYIEITRPGLSGRVYRKMENGLQGPNMDNSPTMGFYEALVTKGHAIPDGYQLNKTNSPVIPNNR